MLHIFSFQALFERASGEPAKSVRLQRKKDTAVGWSCLRWIKSYQQCWM